MSTSRQFVSITEQPAGKLQRFRYLSEVDGARSVGSIPGVNSTPDRKTFPTIRVHGHQGGPFLVLLSLLNPDNNLVHPHSITGSDPRYTCRHGVIYIIADKPEVIFKNIGILCVKGKTEKDVKAALKIRREMNVDPFRAGFQHIEDHRLIDFTAVRLCFQVFLPGKDWTPADLNDPRKYTKSLPPVASDVVYDAKKLNDLKIVYINSCAGSVLGGNEMTLLCDKYTGQNPDVVFEDERGWSRTAAVTMYHKQLAIVFVAPPYREDQHPNCTDLKVKVYLQQSSERGVQRSKPAVVEYLPRDPNGGPVTFPTPTQFEKSNMSLKQVRIQQSPSLGRSSPEDACFKRWRPWGRGAPPPEPSVSDSEEEHSLSRNDELGITAPTSNADGRADAIPLFDPATSEFYTHEWISKIDQLGAVFNWSDTVKSYYMQTRLFGIAKVWLSSLRNIDDMTWPEWKAKLLETFPQNRKVDYVELLKEMLAQRNTISEKAQYYYNKNALLARYEMNAKKAYACLIEGLPLQMKTHHGQYETHGLLHPQYDLDMNAHRMNPPQIHPINLNIANYKFGMNVPKDDRTGNLNCYNLGSSGQEDDQTMNLNDMDDWTDTYGQDDRRRGCCCCKEKPRVIRRCLLSRLNESRPSCIQRHLRRPVIEPSWHQPCSTLTSSSSSPSIANPVPDLLTDQVDMKETLAPSYPGTILSKKPPWMGGKLQQQQKDCPPREVQVPICETSDNQLFSPPAIHADHGLEVPNSNNAVPAGTGVKRTIPDGSRVTCYSGELPVPKRDKLMSSDFGVPECKTSTFCNFDNLFNIPNVPLSHVWELPAPTACFGIKEENIVEANNPVLPNEPLANNPNNIDPTKPTLCSDEIFEQYLDLLGSKQIKDMRDMVHKEEQWYSQRANLDNVILQNANNYLPRSGDHNYPPNNDCNLFGDLNQTNDVSMSEELRKMNFED